MEITKKLTKLMTPFQWFEVLVAAGFTLYFAVTDKETPVFYNIISSAATICGIICVVLCAAGRKAQYYWGFANIAAYIVVAWLNKFYGEVMLNALYYLPSQFVGIYMWKKNYNAETNKVNGRKLKPLTTVIIIALTGVGIVLYKKLLSLLGGNSAWLDSTSTVISVTANALMVMRYREQWFLWLIVDSVTVVMWGMRGDPIMTTMWAVYLLNAFYGYFNWTKLAKAQSA